MVTLLHVTCYNYSTFRLTMAMWGSWNWLTLAASYTCFNRMEKVSLNISQLYCVPKQWVIYKLNFEHKNLATLPTGRSSATGGCCRTNISGITTCLTFWESWTSLYDEEVAKPCHCHRFLQKPNCIFSLEASGLEVSQVYPNFRLHSPTVLYLSS